MYVVTLYAKLEWRYLRLQYDYYEFMYVLALSCARPSASLRDVASPMHSQRNLPHGPCGATPSPRRTRRWLRSGPQAYFHVLPCVPGPPCSGRAVSAVTREW